MAGQRVTTIKQVGPLTVAETRRGTRRCAPSGWPSQLATLNERVLHHLATNYDSPAEDEPS
jgi:hypothetical protein